MKQIPVSIYQGDSVLFTLDLSPIKPAEGWVVRLHLNSSDKQATITATPSTEKYQFSLTTTATTALTEGDYAYAIIASKDAQRKTLNTGNISVKLDPRIETKIILSHNETILKGLKAAQIKAVESGEIVEHTLDSSVGGSTIKFNSIAELTRLVSFYQEKVNKEKRPQRNTPILTRIKLSY